MHSEAHRPRFVVTTVEVEGREEEAIVEIPEFEPVPWGPRARQDLVGKRMPRADAIAKVTGAARYTADIRVPGMLYARFLRSPIACGRLTALDVSAARALPGVQAVFTARDVPAIEWMHGAPLLGGRVVYAGQPVAAVAADSPRAARAAVRAMHAEWMPRRHRVIVNADTPPRRGSGAPARPVTERHQRGNVERAIDAAPVVVTQTYSVAPVIHQAMEPHGSVVSWEGDHLTVYDSTQGIFRVRRELARYLGLLESQVRVVSDYMGGGFGAKNNCGAYTVLAALLARRTRRPVSFMLDRAEECVDAGHRPATVMRVTVASERDGRLQAIDFEAWIALGADGWWGGPGQLVHRLYRCANVRTVEHFHYTNVGPMSAFRAPFYVEGAFALESAMDLVARRLRRDPIAVRLLNRVDTDQDRDRPYSTNQLLACYEEVARRIDWGKRRKSRRKASGRQGTVRGIGLAAQLWGAGGGPPAYAEVRVNRDGTVIVATGTQDLGTGTRTALAQIAGEVLGLGLDRVRVVLGDTDAGPYAGNSWGSMTMASVGPAVRMAAEDARRQLLEVAAELLEVSSDRLTVRRGRVFVGSGRKSMAIERVTEHLGNIMLVGRGHRGPNPESVSVASFGAQAAEVEVDLETGVVRVIRIVAAHDCGRAVNPELAESQLHGGILQGLGYALFERRVHDPSTGVVLNAGLHDYKIPTLADTPSIEARVISDGDPMANHIGVKGLGEPPIIPTAPAIANAVYDAVGVQPMSLPLTPAVIRELLRTRRARHR